MPTICRREDCNGAVTMTDSNGETNPKRDRVEFYECEHGHTFTVVLEGAR